MLGYNTNQDFYPPTKSDGYSFGIVRPSFHTHPQVHTKVASKFVVYYV